MEIESVILESILQKIGEKRFEMWFGKDVHFKLADSILYVGLPTSFLCNWIRTNFKHIIAQVCVDLFGRTYSMEFLVSSNSNQFDNEIQSFRRRSDESKESPRPAKSENGSKSLSVESKPTEAVRSPRKNRPSVPRSSRPGEFQATNFSAPAFDPNPANRLNEIESETVESKTVESKTVESKTLEPKASQRKTAGRKSNAPLKKADDERPDEPRSSRTPKRPTDDRSTAVFQVSTSNERPLSFSKSEDDSFSNVPKKSKRSPVAPTKRTSSTDSLKIDSAIVSQQSRLDNPIEADSIPTPFFWNETVQTPNRSETTSARPSGKTPRKNNPTTNDVFSSLKIQNDPENPQSSPKSKSPGRPSRNRSTSIPETPIVESRPESVSNIPPKKPGRKPLIPKTDANDDASIFLTDDRGNFNVVSKRSPKTASAQVSASEIGRDFASYSSFVEGLSNQLARRVSDIAIFEPGKMSPLLIFGSTSVGKTHLLEGIWSEYRRNPKRRPPVFMTAEQFTSQFVQSLRTNGQPFRNRFKNISLFVLDDLHFLEGKISTQTELLNLIDYLKSQNVQMVFSADRSLGELTGLKSEIVSRIESGIVCRIDPPERETLLGIFRQMSIKRGLDIPDDVCRFVVSRFATHARQISGALNRLHATHLATGRPFSLPMAEDALKDMIRDNRRTIRLEDIDKAVLDVFNLSGSSLQSRSRAKQICYPRMLAMWLARKYTRNALSEIGRYFGNRSHSAVISAQKRVEQWIQNDSPVDQGENVWTVSETLHKIERVLNGV